MKTSVYTILICLFVFCSNKKTEQKSFNESLECAFLQSGLRSPANISCDYLNSSDFKKYKHIKLIDNQKTLDEFKKKLKNLSSNKVQDNVDVRIQIIFSYHSKKDTICMGEYSGISINGSLMNDSKKFHNFIKEIIEYNYTLRHPITGKMIPKKEILNDK